MESSEITAPPGDEPYSRRNSAVLYMLAGKIGAGKSTLAGKLARQPRTIVFSEDQLLAELYPGEIKDPGDYIRSAIRLKFALKDHIVRLLREGFNVVLDFPANTPDSRRWGRELFEAANVPHELHFIDTPNEICKARLRARNKIGEHPFQASDAEFDLFCRFFIAPTPGEGFNVIRHAE
ncbi:MAG: ATP-binding protein [Alphaproteobacteria bacterium]|nr:MAG: ATP-binding protein [Alphaproteobacteria bacterium]